MKEDQLTGKRRTIVRPIVENAPEAVIEDDFKTSEDPMRLLQERWKGETWFEIKPEHSSGGMKQVRKTKGSQEEDLAPPDPIVEERLEDKDDAEDEEQGQQDGQVFPDVPEALPDARDSELTSALRTRGPNAVDGVPGLLQQPSPGETQCSVPGCELPGGHEGPHQGHDRRSFSWTPFGGRVNVDESSSSEDSEEMIPDEDRGSSSPRTSAMKRPYGGDEEDVFYALELEVTKEDGIYLSNHPRKAAIWLSRKVQEKGKETQWSRLTLDQKKEFDLAQAKEITNVVQSKALRSLTEQE